MPAHSGEPEVAINAADTVLKHGVIAALREVYDPEIPINVYDLGLVYRLDITNKGEVTVHMSLTSPGSHLSYFIPRRVRQAVIAVEGVGDCQVELVWDPPWSTDRVSMSVRRKMNIPVPGERA